MKTVLPSKSKSTKIDKLFVDGVEITDPKGISDSLNSYFTSIATDLLSVRESSSTSSRYCNSQHELLSWSQPFPASDKFSPTRFHFRPTTDDEIYSLSNLKSNKATGNDNIPAIILKISASCISQSLSHIINSTFETGIFPNRWKTAKISSIFKGNVRTNRDHYRPISVLPCLSKICESCVNNQVQGNDSVFKTFLESNQFAYAKHSSTTTALIQVIDSLKLAVDQKQYSVATFIDLRKAFDVIDHGVLLDRLETYGFGEQEVNWFRSYLTGRQQYVVCNDVQSELLSLDYGVPQGSVLGPSMFCLLFNSIALSFIDSSPSLYADDIEVHCSNSDLDLAQLIMNQDLKRVDLWLAKNRMIPNVKKKMYGHRIVSCP